MTLDPMNLKMHTVKLTSVNRRRDAAWIPLHGRVTYIREEKAFLYTSEGVLQNLSEMGSDIRRRNPPAVDSQITLTLYLEDQQPLLCLTRTTVSWVVDDFFHGVLCCHLSASDTGGSRL